MIIRILEKIEVFRQCMSNERQAMTENIATIYLMSNIQYFSSVWE